MKGKFRKHDEIIGVYYWNDHYRICISEGTGEKWIKRNFFLTLLGIEHLSIFNFIQQKSPTSISGKMNVKLLSIQWGFEPRLNEVKASGGCHRF